MNAPTYTPAQVLAATKAATAELRELTDDTAVIQQWLIPRVRAKLAEGAAA